MIGRTTKLRRAYPTAAGAAASGLAAMIALTTGSAVADPLPPVPTLPTVTQTATVNPVAGTPLTGPSMAAAPDAGTPAQAAPTVPGLVPATTGTLKEYFTGKHVAMEPQRAQDFRALNITLPVPSGWAKVPDPNVPDAFHVIADRVGGDGLYTSNAQLVVYKLNGDFDPNEAITHGFTDSQALRAWQTTDAALGDFNGFPSAVIEGTYRDADVTLNTSRRHVIATTGPDRYLVSLTVTTSVTQAVPTAGATDAIVSGFRVAAPAAPDAPSAPPGRPPVP